MLSALLLSLLVPTVGASANTAPATTQDADPAVKIWVSDTDVRLGDRVKTHVRTEYDGYLVVLHAEADGRVRVLFPLDPGDDNFIRGGKKYEVRGRGDRRSFQVYAGEGTGTVYAAFSRDPFAFDGLVRGDHWDYTLADTWTVEEDDEAELTDFALRLASGAYFDYDLVQYSIEQRYAVDRGYDQHLTRYEPYYLSRRHYGPSLGFSVLYGPRYMRARRYALLGSPYYGGHGFSIGIGIGLGHCDPYYYDSFLCDPFFYDPFFYDPFYYGSGFGHRSGFGFGSRFGFSRPSTVFFADNRLRLSPRTRPFVSSGRSGRRVFTAARRTGRVTPGPRSASTGRRSAIARRHTTTRVNRTKRATGVEVRRRIASGAGRSAGQKLDGASGRRTASASGTRARGTAAATSSTTRRRAATSAQATRPDGASARRSVRSRATASSSRSPQKSRKAVTTARRSASRAQTPTVRRRTSQSRSSVQIRSRTATRSRPSVKRSSPSRTNRPSIKRSSPRTSRPSVRRPSVSRSSRPSIKRSSPSRARSSARSSGNRRRKP